MNGRRDAFKRVSMNEYIAICLTYEWVGTLPYVTLPRPQCINMSCSGNESFIRMMNESCHTCEWVMPHRRMSHVTHANESCHTGEWVMSHMQMSYVTLANESCHTGKWVMSHMQMSHVTLANKSCHTCKRVMSHMRMSHINACCHVHARVVSPIHACDI